jgi:hypothetical protein
VVIGAPFGFVVALLTSFLGYDAQFSDVQLMDCSS